MKVYLTGGDGYIGRALQRIGYKALCCDVTTPNFVNKEIDRASPDIVIHLAGKTDVDWCEKNIDLSIAVNIGGTKNVMEACYVRKIPVIFLSSYHVWGGGWTEFSHKEYSKLTPAVNQYGAQKAGLEAFVSFFDMRSVKIIRPGYVFNEDRLAPQLSALANGRTIDAPTFLKRSFIHLNHFVEQVEQYVRRFTYMPPVLHLAGSKTVSYCDFWMEVCSQFGFDKNLVQCRRKEFKPDSKHPAKRPHNGGLNVDLSKELRFLQYDYIDGIGRMLSED